MSILKIRSLALATAWPLAGSATKESAITTWFRADSGGRSIETVVHTAKNGLQALTGELN
jgi:hypothetical protein